MKVELARHDMEAAFDLLGKLALDRGLSVEIAVFGGSCLVLASDIRNSSGDVDAVFRGHEPEIYAMLEAVAIAQQLPHNWLNQGVKRLAPPIGNPEPNLIPHGHYPREALPASGLAGLRVLLPTPAYLLAMKLLANRGSEDVDKIQTDTTDAVALMKVTGIVSRDQIVELLQECYPHVPGVATPGLSPRMAAKIDAILDAYEGSSKDDHPAWNAGRGPATRP
ncbi:hypothetical protein [Aquibium microcysteis]|uniref:hypothetical protein n=1 Tax=Aquibium microcysteis TaxID=675281 RepID=UPI00165CF491|nr:hypothetical protein [Aquibium microcysteis]